MNDKQMLIRYLHGEVNRLTGKVYRIDYAALDIRSLNEIRRLVADLEYDRRAAVNRARRTPLWAGLIRGRDALAGDQAKRELLEETEAPPDGPDDDDIDAYPGSMRHGMRGFTGGKP
jgi:hypothetical protein